MKLTRRLLALLLAVILGLGLGGISAAAEEDVPEEIAFEEVFAFEEAADLAPAEAEEEGPAPIEEQSVLGGFIADIVFTLLNSTFFGTVFYRVRNFLNASTEELIVFFPVYILITVVVYIFALPLNILSGLFSNFLRAPAE